MAAETDGLLVHGNFVGEDGRLGEDAGGVQLGVGQHLGHPGLQLGAVLRHRLGGALLHQGHLVLDGLGPAEYVILQPLALSAAHLVKVGQGPVQHRADVFGHLLHVLLRLLCQQHVGEAGQQGHGDVPRQVIVRRQLLQGGIIAVGHRLVHRHLDLLRPGVVQGDEHVHLSPGNGILNAALHGLLREQIEAGQADVAVQIAVVHRAQLHRDGAAVYRLLCPAIAGHALDHIGHSPFMCV